MSSKVLATGFERFGLRIRPNPSGEVVLPALKGAFGDDVEIMNLPVAYDDAAAKVREKLQADGYLAVVMFGSSGYFSRHVAIEEQGINFRSNLGSLVPDNNFRYRHGRIINGAPAVLPTTLPTERIHTRLESEGVPTKLSASAGCFVCNDLLYQMLYEASEHEIPTGFMHVGAGLHAEQTALAAVSAVEEVIQYAVAQQPRSRT